MVGTQLGSRNKGYYVNLGVSAIKRGRHRVGGSRRGDARHREASPWRPQPAAQRGAPLLMAGGVMINFVSSWLGHANVQVRLRIYLPIVGSDYGMDAVP